MKVSSSSAVLAIVLVGVGAFGIKTVLHRRAVSNSRKEFAESDNFSKQGKIPEAIVAMRKSVQDDPQYIDARETLADMLVTNNKLEEAVSVLNEGTDADPANKSRYYYDISEDYKLNKEYDKAIDYVKKSIEAKPGDAQASKTLPFLLESAKRYDEAEQEWLKFEKSYPTDMSAKRGISRIQRLKNPPKETTQPPAAKTITPTSKAGGAVTKPEGAPTKPGASVGKFPNDPAASQAK